eukprot:CAMPEP_0113950660 /NCGR_PEP_ID=MMETSP1339-20121228/81934_1 /TAXON_ID=94617 /ORGANISM="Fibrocapsa japonica" /LENGTH=77 /DNA_ID=CAMNT_0000958575 /DNA_START=56 /DNA_END=285 /DNA_ORIENTATION=+ /assembly_acc=CAM_ASM_000762
MPKFKKTATSIVMYDYVFLYESHGDALAEFLKNKLGMPQSPGGFQYTPGKGSPASQSPEEPPPGGYSFGRKKMEKRR